MIRFILLIVGLMQVIPALAESQEPSVPRLDKLLLHAPEQFDRKYQAILDVLKPFCETLKQNESAVVDQDARESCELEKVVTSLRETEKNLKLSFGEPFLLQLLNKEDSESQLWRYYINVIKFRHVVVSLRNYFSKHAGINGNRVGMIGLPVFAASADRFSYWSRLAAMVDSQACVKDSGFCSILRAQLQTLAKQAWQAANIEAHMRDLDERHLLVRQISFDLSSRLSKMSVAELVALENMEDVTSAGVGIPFFRQIVANLKLTNAEMTPSQVSQVRSVLFLVEIHDDIDRWGEPEMSWQPDPQSLKKLTEELVGLKASYEQTSI